LKDFTIKRSTSNIALLVLQQFGLTLALFERQTHRGAR
jgi:hypothetical protein